MNCKIPFTKDIDFEKKLYEITSISLEHEINVEEDTLKGNFIVSGDFKSHEVSVNKELFSYSLPFEIALNEDIDKETIEFMIEDFTYEIVNDSILRVNIDFSVIASQKEIIKEEEERNNPLELFEKPNIEMDNSLILEETNKINEVPEPEKEVKEEIITEKNQETIINSIEKNDQEYATYHIHMVSDGETVETICSMYNSNMNILAEYNDLTEVTSGDKLIIPDKDE